jgi:hypothetical protein
MAGRYSRRIDRDDALHDERGNNEGRRQRMPRAGDHARERSGTWGA